MLNPITLLDLLKWNTDESHPLTQNKLRKIKNITLDKKTFLRHLFLIADTYNTYEDNRNIIKDISNWKIHFPGYKLKRVDIPNALETESMPPSYYTGPIYFHHEISPSELRFLIGQLNNIPLKEKTFFTLRLIRELGTCHFSKEANILLDDTIDNIDFSDSKTLDMLDEIFPTSSFSTSFEENFYSNVQIIQEAILRERIIQFNTSVVTEKGHLIPELERILLSPYKIVCYKGYYWLIGNQRLGDYIDPISKHPRYKYSNTLDIFRIDKMMNVSIAEKQYELHSKTKFMNINLDRCLEILSKRLHIYRENFKIKGSDISDNYGEISFEVLWSNFNLKTLQKDYSFIFDTFGNNFTVCTDNSTTIVQIHADREVFIDWALINIDKIRIINDGIYTQSILNELKEIINRGQIILNDNT